MQPERNGCVIQLPVWNCTADLGDICRLRHAWASHLRAGDSSLHVQQQLCGAHSSLSHSMLHIQTEPCTEPPVISMYNCTALSKLQSVWAELADYCQGSKSS